MPYAAMAGTESGTTIIRNTPMVEAPSIRAASIRSRGSVMKKLRNRKMPNGNAKAVCVSQIAPNPFSSPVGANIFSNGMNATWTGTISSRHDQQEGGVAKREAKPREGVCRHRRQRTAAGASKARR